YMKAAIDLTLENDNLYLLNINSFSCTTDAFTQQYIRSELQNKPYLMLELDAHTADAGIQTRLEAFLEIVKNYQVTEKESEEKPFQVARVKQRGGKVVVITSEGKQISIKNPRITLYMPSYAKYVTDVAAQGMRNFGYNFGPVTEMKLEYAVKGLRCSSGKECIPLPVVLGQIMTLIENRKPGEIIGMYMIRGGAPCAVYSYYHYIEEWLYQNKIENVFLFRFDYLTDFLGMKLVDVIRFVPSGIIVGDLMLEIESALQVVGDEQGLKVLQNYWSEFVDSIESIRTYKKAIRKLIKNIKKIPRTNSPKDQPKVVISGDFFVRFSPFFIRELKEIYAKHGIIVKSTDLFELGVYGQHYNSGYLIEKEWKKDPAKLTTVLRASATLWTEASRILLIGKIGIRIMQRIESRMRRRFKKTGLLYAQSNDLDEIYRLSGPYISPLIFGEAIPTIGKGLETLEGSDFDSMILTGPFNCLPYKISQAILKPIYLEHNMPFLVFDVDISAITPNTKRLIHANIEQIKRRRQDLALMEQRRRITNIRERVSRIVRRRMRKRERFIEKRTS
ncbi:MAG: hypothetical protein ACTSR6_09710, partial [Candidatus Heimdallarchaeota archaeon]